MWEGSGSISESTLRVRLAPEAVHLILHSLEIP